MSFDPVAHDTVDIQVLEQPQIKNGDIDALKPRLWLEAIWQGLLHNPKVVWLADGGRSFWRLFDQHLAQYTAGMLDFYHAVQTLWKGGQKLVRWPDPAGPPLVYHRPPTLAAGSNQGRAGPLGVAGMVESACKWLTLHEQCFRGVGMRWSEDSFNHLLHLRLAWVNRSFDDLFALAAPPT